MAPWIIDPLVDLPLIIESLDAPPKPRTTFILMARPTRVKLVQREMADGEWKDVPLARVTVDGRFLTIEGLGDSRRVSVLYVVANVATALSGARDRDRRPTT